MSLEPNLAALVAASTKLTKSITMPLSEVNGKRDAATTAQADITSAESAIATAATTSTTDAATTASKLTAVAADYATQKTTKGLAAVQTSADSELKDRLHRRDPARYPFRGARPSLVMDFVRQECHRNNAAGNLEPVDLSTFMTFTRASTATYVGPDGLIKEVASNVPRYGYDPVTGEALGLLIEEQRTNLLYNSVTLRDPINPGSMTQTRMALSPSGLMDANKFTPAAVLQIQSTSSPSVATTIGTEVTFSIFLKYAGYAEWAIYFSNTGDGDLRYGVSFNLLSGIATPGACLNTCGQAEKYSITPCGNGWYRVSITLAGAYNDGLITTNLRYTGGAVSYNNALGDGVSGVYYWGAQVEHGSFPTSYIPNPATFTGRESTKTYFDSNGVLQTAASGVAVTDYGYVDGRWVSKGLSLEPQATNLLTNSGNLTLGGWFVNSVTRAVSGVLAPDGISYATKITETADSTAASHYLSQTPAASYSTQYTGSCFMKAAERTKGLINMHTGDNNIAATFDLTLGTVVSVAAGGTARITPYGNGWFRCEVTATTGASGSPNMAVFTCDATGAVTYIGDGVSGIYAWGAQYAAGPVATSYIPTTTAQVTRAADTSTSAQVTRAAENATVSGSNFTAGWYTPDGWSLGVQFMSPYTHTQYNRGVFGFGSGVNLRGVGLRLYNDIDGASIFIVRDTATNINSVGQATASVAGVKYTAGCGVAPDGAARYSLNNSALSKTDSGFVRPTINALYIGRQNAAGALGYTNGYIRQLTYFPRQLSDADLQALTILED